MEQTVVVRYGEIALKSPQVRRGFEQRLLGNIRLALEGINHKLVRERGRIFVDTRAPSKVVKRLAQVPGVVSVSPAVKIAADRDAIHSSAVKVAQKALPSGGSFAVRTIRVGKHPFTSQDINKEIGTAVLEEVPGTSVNLNSPDRKIHIEIRGKNAYIFTRIAGGVGGLPVGTQGTAVSLLSGSPNSLVASLLMLRRGCRVCPLLFDGASGAARELAISSARRLLGLHPGLELRVVAFDEVREALGNAPNELSHPLRMRAMLRAAEELARELGGDALITGETVKSSHCTLRSFQTEDDAVELRVLRPLAGLSGPKIKWIARRFGVRMASASSPRPKHSKSDVTLEEIRRLERESGINSAIKAALKKVETVNIE